MKHKHYRFVGDPFIFPTRIYPDNRGLLQTLDTSELPFKIKRIFTITPSSPQTVRGGHAHKKCWQAILPVGSLILISGKNSSKEFFFDLEPGSLLIVPPWNWLQVRFEWGNSSAVIFCSHLYSSGDYIFDLP
jgi:hypothetical protein